MFNLDSSNVLSYNSCFMPDFHFCKQLMTKWPFWLTHPPKKWNISLPFEIFLFWDSFYGPLINVLTNNNLQSLGEKRPNSVTDTEKLCFVGWNLFKVMKLMKAENVSFCNEIVTAEDWCRGETRELTMFGGNTTNSFQKSNTALTFILIRAKCQLSIICGQKDKKTKK